MTDTAWAVRVPQRRWTALLWKEWRQLAMLRMVSIVLGLLLVVVCIASPAASRAGWIPFFSVSSGDARTVLGEVLPPMLALFFGPLVAILLAAQSHAGDRSTGNESFLLGLPVRRSSVWLARIAATAASLLVALAAAWALWAMAIYAQGGISPEMRADALWWAGVGTLCAFGSLVPGTAAGTLVPSPMSAVLLALVLAAIPVYASNVLAGWSYFAKIGDFSIGTWIPALLVLGYLAVSYLATCRGEPAGRGRLRRAGLALAVVVVSTIVVFVVAATLAVPWTARQWLQGVVPSPAQSNAVVTGGMAGWLFDPDTGTVDRFLPPPIHMARWNEDGSRLAILTQSGRFGSLRGFGRLEFLDRSGRPVAESIRLPILMFVTDSVWRGDRLFLLAQSPSFTDEPLSEEEASDGIEAARKANERLDYKARLLAIDTGSSRIREISLPVNSLVAEMFETKPGGPVFLSFALGVNERVAGSAAGERQYRRDLRLYEVDLEGAGSVSSQPVFRYERVKSHLLPLSISPSGRYVLGDLAGNDRPVLDRRDGMAEVDRVPKDSGWLEGDVLYWTRSGEDERSLVMARIGHGPAVGRSWPARWLHLRRSPDARRLLVQPVLSESKVGSRETGAAWIYDAVTGAWTELPPWPALEPANPMLDWAAPHTLARFGRRTLDVRSIEPPHDTRTVFGR